MQMTEDDNADECDKNQDSVTSACIGNLVSTYRRMTPWRACKQRDEDNSDRECGTIAQAKNKGREH